MSSRAERAAARAAAREKALAEAEEAAGRPTKAASVKKKATKPKPKKEEEKAAQAPKRDRENEAKDANLAEAKKKKGKKDAGASTGASATALPATEVPAEPTSNQDDELGQGQQKQEDQQEPPEVLYWPDGVPMKKREMRVRAFVEEELRKLENDEDPTIAESHTESLDDKVLLYPTFRERLYRVRTMADAKSLLREYHWAMDAMNNLVVQGEDEGKTMYFFRKGYSLDADLKRLVQDAMWMEECYYCIKLRMSDELFKMVYGRYLGGDGVAKFCGHSRSRKCMDLLHKNSSAIQELLASASPWTAKCLKQTLIEDGGHSIPTVFTIAGLQEAKDLLDKVEKDPKVPASCGNPPSAETSSPSAETTKKAKLAAPPRPGRPRKLHLF